MDLQQLKKEVRELPSAMPQIAGLQEHWIKALRTNGNYRHSFMDNLDPQVRKQVKQKLSRAQSLCQELKASPQIPEKLRQYSRFLVELKLASFRKDKAKSKLLSQLLVQDEYLRLSRTIAQIKEMEEKVQVLKKHYHETNQLLEQHLSLEEKLFLTGLPHRQHLRNLLKITEKQKKIMQDIGHNFISLAREDAP